MTSNSHHSHARQPRRTVGILLLLFALSVGLIAALPSGTPVALAARLFQSPVESPPAPTVAPEQPTPLPEQPTQEAPTPPPAPAPTEVPPTEAPPTPTEAATFTPEPAPIQQQPTIAPVEQTPADTGRLPDRVQEPEDKKIDWVKLIDTTVMIFSWFWLACGVVVVIVVVILLIVIYRRSKRRPK